MEKLELRLQKISGSPKFNSLQAQINPHFLYNTMDMINWMALRGQTNEICHAVQSLSRFYKLTLSRKKGISYHCKGAGACNHLRAAAEYALS
ncbi:MAG: sensor histidine kinase [Blautia faecis]